MELSETTDEPVPRKLSLSQAQVGLRLDRALAELLPEISRTRLKELILDGGVWFEGECLRRPSARVETGGEIEIRSVPRARERSGAASEAEPRVLFEDEDLAIIDKPAGQISHPTSVVRGGSVSEWAAARWGELPAPQGEDRPGIVHRLDSDTSGLMIVAKSERAAPALLAAFRDRKVEKRYLALVHGVPRFDSDWIEAPIGRSRKRSDRMSVIENPRPEDEPRLEPLRIGEEPREPEDKTKGGKGLEASTFYTTRERLGRFALLECQPKTGRTHQIRVHLTHIEHPLVGDRVYPGRKRVELPRQAPPMARHALHAAGLIFEHPVSGESVHFECSMPEDMQRFLAWAREQA